MRPNARRNRMEKRELVNTLRLVFFSRQKYMLHTFTRHFIIRNKIDFIYFRLSLMPQNTLTTAFESYLFFPFCFKNISLFFHSIILFSFFRSVFFPKFALSISFHEKWRTPKPFHPKQHTRIGFVCFYGNDDDDHE